MKVELALVERLIRKRARLLRESSDRDLAAASRESGRISRSHAPISLELPHGQLRSAGQSLYAKSQLETLLRLLKEEFKEKKK